MHKYKIIHVDGTIITESVDSELCIWQPIPIIYDGKTYIVRNLYYNLDDSLILLVVVNPGEMA